MDEDNFEMVIGQWHITMTNGQLTINNCDYEESYDDPTYDFVREIWRLKKDMSE